MRRAIGRALRSSAFIAVVVAALAQGAFAQAQKGAPPLRINFRALTDEGQQVADLTTDELTLKINGKPRPILSLSMTSTATGDPRRARPADSILDQHPGHVRPSLLSPHRRRLDRPRP